MLYLIVLLLLWVVWLEVRVRILTREVFAFEKAYVHRFPHADK
jgi:hypothetical protein